MVRKIPKMDVQINESSYNIEQMHFVVELITPLFGGGVEAQKINPEQLIRAPEIRGQLRFWWRATRGKLFLKDPNPIKKMFEREIEIFGSTDYPSPFAIHIGPILSPEKEKFPNADNWTVIEKNDRYKVDIWNYIFFPFKNKSQKFNFSPDSNTGLKRVVFHISITQIHTNKEILFELECAFWAWFNFGGIGARTRRGCGALYCHSADFKFLNNEEDPFNNKPDFESYPKWIQKWIKYFKIPMDNLPHEPLWPVLGGIYFKNEINQIDAWKNLIKTYRDFRRGIKIGRSRWPESESIRRYLLTQNKIKNRPETWKKWDERMENIEGYPRVQFGLPIIMELRHSKIYSKKNSPKPILQFSEENDRLASPLIIRPAIIGDFECIGIYIELNVPKIKSILINPGGSDFDLLKPVPIMDPDKIYGQNLSDYEDSPMQYSSTGSVIDAFLNFAQEEHGWMKVDI
jgi:CRISPR-associated protein Cmr1